MLVGQPSALADQKVFNGASLNPRLYALRLFRSQLACKDNAAWICLSIADQLEFADLLPGIEDGRDFLLAYYGSRDIPGDQLDQCKLYSAELTANQLLDYRIICQHLLDDGLQSSGQIYSVTREQWSRLTLPDVYVLKCLLLGTGATVVSADTGEDLAQQLALVGDADWSLYDDPVGDFSSTSAAALAMRDYIAVAINCRHVSALARVFNAPSRCLGHAVFTELKRRCQAKSLPLFQVAKQAVSAMKSGSHIDIETLLPSLSGLTDLVETIDSLQQAIANSRIENSNNEGVVAFASTVGGLLSREPERFPQADVATAAAAAAAASSSVADEDPSVSADLSLLLLRCLDTLSSSCCAIVGQGLPPSSPVAASTGNVPIVGSAGASGSGRKRHRMTAELDGCCDEIHLPSPWLRGGRGGQREVRSPAATSPVSTATPRRLATAARLYRRSSDKRAVPVAPVNDKCRRGIFASLCRRPIGSLLSRCANSAEDRRPFPAEFLAGLELAWSDTLSVSPAFPDISGVPLAADFCPRLDRCSLLAVSSADGGVTLLETDRPLRDSHLASWAVACEPAGRVHDVHWLSCDGDRLLTASSDQTVRLHSTLAGGAGREIRAFRGHTGPVRCVSSRRHSQDEVFCSCGSRDGSVRVWDARTGGCVGYLARPHCVSVGGAHRRTPLHPLPVVGAASAAARRPNSNDSDRGSKRISTGLGVTCAIFADSNCLATCGSGGGTVDAAVKLWDLRSFSRPCQVFDNPGCSGGSRVRGFAHLACHHGRLFAASLDSAVYEYRPPLSTSAPFAVYRGHHVANAFEIRVSPSPDGRFLAVGSSDNRAVVYAATDGSSAPSSSSSRTTAVLLGGYEFDTQVPIARWCPAGCEPLRLVTLSSDSTLRLWRLNRRHHWLMEGPQATIERQRLRAVASLATGPGLAAGVVELDTDSPVVAGQSGSTPRFGRQMDIRDFVV